MPADVIKVIQYPATVVRVITAGPQGAPGTGLPDGFELEPISNTRIKISYTGTDDVTRSVQLTIS